MKLKLLNLKKKTEEELNELLKTLTDKQEKDLKEELDYYLLCYPQGTGDDDLEELMETLSLLWYPED